MRNDDKKEMGIKKLVQKDTETNNILPSQHRYQQLLKQICLIQMTKNRNLINENNIKIFVCEAM